MSALNSLSAQYTDSEGEDELNSSSGSRRRISDGSVTSKLPSSPAQSPSPPPPSHSPPPPSSLQSSEQPPPSSVINEDSSSNTVLVSYAGDDVDDAEASDGNVDSDDQNEERMSGSVDMEISVSDEEMFLSAAAEVTANTDSAAANGHESDDDCGDQNAFSPCDSPLPAEPQGNCSRELQETVARLVENQRRTGADMNERFKSKKDFRNPSIYEKLITFCGIDEFGTNYPPELYDPGIWGKQSFYDELARVQKEDMERREKERKERTKVEIVSGTKRVEATDTAARRRTKWDVMAPSVAAGAGIMVQPPPPSTIHPVATSGGSNASHVIAGSTTLSGKRK